MNMPLEKTVVCTFSLGKLMLEKEPVSQPAAEKRASASLYILLYT